MTGCPFIAGTSIGRVFRRQMKGRKKQPSFIAEPFKIKRISESRHANKQIIINVLSLIYDRHERFIFFSLCNNNPPSLSILRINCCAMQMENEIPDSFFLQFIKFDYSFQLFFQINYITILAAPNKQKYICKNNHGYYNRYYFYKRLNVNNIWISLAEKKNQKFSEERKNCPHHRHGSPQSWADAASAKPV